MDPATLAIAAAGVIAKALAEAASSEAGKGLWAGTRKVYERVRGKFTNDEAVGQALDELDAAPADGARQKKLAEVLEPKLQGDQAFAQELHQLIETCREGNSERAQFITHLYDNAKVGQIVNADRIDTFNAGGITMN